MFILLPDINIKIISIKLNIKDLISKRYKKFKYAFILIYILENHIKRNLIEREIYFNYSLLLNVFPSINCKKLEDIVEVIYFKRDTVNIGF